MVKFFINLSVFLKIYRNDGSKFKNGTLVRQGVYLANPLTWVILIASYPFILIIAMAEATKEYISEILDQF